MNTKIWSIATMALAVTLVLFGTSYAGGYGDFVTLSGTINSNNQLIDEHGKAYDVSDAVQGLAVRSQVGNKVELRGTVMDQGGQPTFEVHSYKIKPSITRNFDQQ